MVEAIKVGQLGKLTFFLVTGRENVGRDERNEWGKEVLTYHGRVKIDREEMKYFRCISSLTLISKNCMLFLITLTFSWY